MDMQSGQGNDQGHATEKSAKTVKTGQSISGQLTTMTITTIVVILQPAVHYLPVHEHAKK